MTSLNELICVVQIANNLKKPTIPGFLFVSDC